MSQMGQRVTRASRRGGEDRIIKVEKNASSPNQVRHLGQTPTIDDENPSTEPTKNAPASQTARILVQNIQSSTKQSEP